MIERKSEASEPNLISDPIALAEKEAKNALVQFDWAMEELDRWIKAGRPQLRVSTILHLHRLALDGVHAYAGNFRPAGVAIKGSSHKPISHDDVPRYVEEMLDYILSNWDRKLAIHLASYAMWRLNWIHPFSDGNGRTARIISYMILCAKLGYRLPGTRTIPEQIADNKIPYYKALESADRNYSRGSIDLSDMEQLLENYLAAQLVEVHENAAGPRLHNDSTQSRWGGLVSRLESRPVIVGAVVIIISTILTIIFT